jgi:hypothetical protein
MNIFFLDKDPILAAKYQCDAHVVKMIVETAQILSTAQHILTDEPLKIDEASIYRITHKHQPVSVWCRSNCANYGWTCRHGLALCQEYTYRYGKKHKSQDVIEYCYTNYPMKLSIESEISPPAQVMPEIYQDESTIDGAVRAYRKYYKEFKLHTMRCRWTKREKPEWLL